MTDLHVFLVEPSEGIRDGMSKAMGDEHAWIGHDSLAELAQAIDNGSVPAVVLVGPGIVHDDVVMLASSIREEQVPVALVQFTKSLEPDALREALRSGVSDVVELDGPLAQAREAIARASSDARRVHESPPLVPAAPPEPVATEPVPVVAFAAGKGGVGTSLVATNVAAAIAESGRRATLVDLDLAAGDLAIMLQQRPSLTVADALHRLDHLDVMALEGYLSKPMDNLQLLAAPLEGGEMHVEVARFMRLLDLLAQDSDIILVDAGDGSSPVARAVLAEAEHVVIVGNLEVTSVRGTRMLLSQTMTGGRPRDTMTLVANESDMSTGLSIGDIEKALDTAINTRIPTEKNAAQSINRGQPLVGRRRSKAGAALTQLAERITGAVNLT